MPNPPKKGGGKRMSNQIKPIDNESLKAIAGMIAQKTPKPRRTKSEWRSILAFLLMGGFLVIILIIVVVDQVWGAKTDAPTMLATVGSLISSPLSFILGYYYNKDKNGN